MNTLAQNTNDEKLISDAVVMLETLNSLPWVLLYVT